MWHMNSIRPNTVPWGPRLYLIVELSFEGYLAIPVCEESGKPSVEWSSDPMMLPVCGVVCRGVQCQVAWRSRV